MVDWLTIRNNSKTRALPGITKRLLMPLGMSLGRGAQVRLRLERLLDRVYVSLGMSSATITFWSHGKATALLKLRERFPMGHRGADEWGKSKLSS